MMCLHSRASDTFSYFGVRSSQRTSGRKSKKKMPTDKINLRHFPSDSWLHFTHCTFIFGCFLQRGFSILFGYFFFLPFLSPSVVWFSFNFLGCTICLSFTFSLYLVFIGCHMHAKPLWRSHFFFFFSHSRLVCLRSHSFFGECDFLCLCTLHVGSLCLNSYTYMKSICDNQP